MRICFALFLIPCIFIFVNVHAVSAETWIENFNRGNLDSWTVIPQDHPVADRGNWQVKKGRLDVEIELPWGPGIFEYHTLKFTGFDLHAKQLNVKVNVLEAQNANVGILIGQYDQWGNMGRRTYKFLRGSSIWGPIEFPNQQPDVKYADLKEIEVNFDKGHFELLSEGKQILEFDEPNLPYVNCIGIRAYVWIKGPPVHFVLDDFIISGPSLRRADAQPVRPRGKAAVLWGELKRQ